MKGLSMVQPSTGENPTLRRSIKLIELTVYGLLFVAPTGLAGLFGTIYVKSQGALVTVYVVATIVMALTAASYAHMAKAVPTAGSVFSYAGAGLGRVAGFIGGWMMLLDYVLIPSVAYLFAGFAMSSAIPTVPAWLWTAILVIGTTLCNLRGVRFAARVGIFVASAELLVVAVVFVAGLAVLKLHGAPHSWSLPFTGQSGLTIGLISAAVSVAVFSFLGFDGIASFAEENSGEPRVVGRAMVLCLVLSGVVLIALSFVSVMIEPSLPSKLPAAAEGTAFYDSIRVSISSWLSIVFSFVKALGSAFCAMVGQAAASRLLFAMSRERTLPRVLGRVSERTRVPVVATWALGLLSLVIAVWASLASNGLDTLSSTVNAGALSGFLLVHLSVIGYFVIKKKQRHWLRYVIVPVIGAATTIVLIISASHDALIVGGLWLVVGLVILLVRGQRPQTREGLPALVSGEDFDLPREP